MIDPPEVPADRFYREASPEVPVYAALAAVMEDVKAVAKADRNEHQRFMFRGIDAVVNAVSPSLRKHRVVVVPRVQSVSYELVQTSTGKPATACRIVADYVFTGPAGDCLTATVIGEAWDNGDKAAPKAMSVAFRTALLQALSLPTDDLDPDAHSYEQAAPVAARPTSDERREREVRIERDAVEPETRRMSRPVVSSQITKPQLGNIGALMRQVGIVDRDKALAYVAEVIGREVESRNDLTKTEAGLVIDALEREVVPA